MLDPLFDPHREETLNPEFVERVKEKLASDGVGKGSVLWCNRCGYVSEINVAMKASECPHCHYQATAHTALIRSSLTQEERKELGLDDR